MGAPFDAVAHLLRHLDDGSALRVNPIAAKYFITITKGAVLAQDREAEAVARVRAMVTAAVAQLFLYDEDDDEDETVHLRQQREIVERCDLRGESHVAVAADLGLSRREFYRERKRARDRLAQYLMGSDQQYHIRSVPNEFDFGLDAAERMSRLGSHESAIASIERWRSRASDNPQRIRANVALASAYCDVGRVEAANEAIHRAREVYAADCRNLETGVCLLSFEIETADARALWLSGRTTEVEDKYQRILAGVRAPYLLRTPRAFELETMALMRLGMLKRDVGETRLSLAFLQQAANVMQALPKPPPPVKAELLANFGLTLMVETCRLAAASEAMQTYLMFSQEHNLLCDTADALANLATLHLQFGDGVVARTFARSGLDLAQSVASKQQAAEILIIAALTETEAGDPRAALDLVAQARADAALGSPSWVLTEIAEAQALLGVRAYRQAWRVASEAEELMSALGMERYRGTALRIVAEAAEGANRPDEARCAIREALRLLEARGHAASLARAYACSARLTQNRRHASLARELLGSLHRSSLRWCRD